MSMGTQALFRGDTPQAIEDLRRSLVADPENVPAHNNLALAYIQMGKRDMAKLELNKAIETDPSNGDANINLGVLAAEDHDFAAARKYYQKAIDNLEFKSRHRAITNMAEIALRENNTDEARRLLYESLQVNPDYCLSHFLLGNIYSKEANNGRAIGEYKKAIRNTCAGNVEAHYQLGLAYVKMKQYDKARGEFLLIMDQHPETIQSQHAAEQVKNIP